MKLIMTNWINLVGVFIMVYFYAIYLNLTDYNAQKTIVQSLLAALFLVLAHGMIFWFGLLLSLVILDMLFAIQKVKMLKTKLLAEWAIISIPFLFWSITYNQTIFCYGIFALLITQLIRVSVIKNALLNTDK